MRLGKLGPTEALGYVVAQFAGAMLGVAGCALLFNPWLSHSAVNYVVTEPGKYGLLSAWLAEFGMAFLMLNVLLSVNRVQALVPYTGLFAAALVALFITFEAPLSGMSLNPARSFGSSLVAHSFHAFWIYLSAPACGMLLGVELRRWLGARHSRLCGKLSHSQRSSCFVHCSCLDRTE